MKNVLRSLLLIAGGLGVLGTAQAQVRITEVDSGGNDATSLGFDWFELSNFGSSAVNITGWKMDDNSNAFSSSVALTGITSIQAGQSVIFAETSSASAQAKFIDVWFGGSAPAGFLFGTYSGSGVGLSSGSGDAVNIFNATGGLMANVTFGAVPSDRTFDNSSGANGSAITALSAVGINGAHLGSDGRIGSPGTYAAPVPLPAGIWLLGSGLGLLGGAVRRRRATVAA